MNYPDLDTWQFRLRPASEDYVAGAPAPNGAHTEYRFGEWLLEVGQGTPVTRVKDALGVDCGVIIGFIVDLRERTEITGGLWNCSTTRGPDADAFVMETRRDLGGLFLWVLPEAETFESHYAARRKTPVGTIHLYTDTAAQVPCVYDPESKVAGMTAHALFDDTTYEERLDQTLFDEVGIIGEGWFPAGHTAHRGLLRLLPNHALDLHAGQVRRVWPVSELSTLEDPTKHLDEVIELIQAQLEALLSGSKKVAIALTAGHETRMLLACARPYLQDIEFVTVAGGGRHQLDTIMAKRIAQDLNLHHRLLPRITATPAQEELFVRRGGHCQGDINRIYHPSVWPIAQSHTLVGGLGGEIGRAFLWRDSDRADTPIDPIRLMGRFGLPAAPQITESLQEWIDNAPLRDTFDLLDFAYAEQRMGPWSGVQFPCNPTLVTHAPLQVDRIFELHIRLPGDWKRASRFGTELIARQWPELQTYPYNDLGWGHNVFKKIRRVVADPGVIVKKLRKLRS